MKPIFFPFVIIFVLLSCKSGVQKQLDLAESLLYQKPDSALIVINSLRTQSLKSTKDAARYALIKTAALDKNYIDVCSDSLITRAVEYFSRKSDIRHKMLADYYHGVILKNEGLFPTAIIAFERAEANAELLQDNHHLGLINRNKSVIFSRTNNNLEAIRCIQKAVSYFDLAKEPVYESYAKLSLAINLKNNKEYERSDSLLVSLRKESVDPNIISYCNLYQADILAETNTDSEAAIHYYRQVTEKYFQILDYAYYALSLERSGYKDSADFWMRKGYTLCEDSADSASLDYVQSKVEVHRNHYLEAFNLRSRACAVQDSLTRDLLKQSISVSQRDYFHNESVMNKERLVAMRKSWFLKSSIIILLFLLVLVCSIWRGREKDRIMQEQMAQLVLNKQIIDNTYKENAFLVGSLFSSRIAHLDTLTEKYYQMENGKEKETVFKTIKETVSSIKNSPEIFISLEKDLDRYCNGIMTKIRQQVPRIKGDNLKIITLFFSGLPDEVTQILLNKVSSESLRMARTRFRKEIIASNAADTDFFLDMLKKKKRRPDDTNESV